ncbi:hypothetical protein ACJZ2D_003127 [Fusarium nematophilum]
MAAEAVGAAIGVVGVLGQLFDGCVKAYGFFTAAANLDTDSQRLLCKVRIEEMRLVVWGRDWGVAEGKLEAHLESTRNPQLRSLALQILGELHSAVTDFRRLRDKYGLLDEGNGKGSSGSEVKSGTKAKGAKVSRDDDEIRKSNGSTKRVEGVDPPPPATDKDKFINFLKDLRDFNDGLERLFPVSHLPSFQRAWTHQLLESAQRDLAQLSLLETAATGVYPQLTASANLKKLRINLDARPQASFKPTFALKVPRPALDIADEDDEAGSGPQSRSSRCKARHESAGDVVIEWVDYDREDIDVRVAHVRRLDDLARMMHSASSCHPDLHSIDCVGYVDDAARCRYGLVYKAPSPSFSTLHDLIASPDLKTPDLDDRVRLAHILAVALWSLHSLDWLHKSLCSANILFFPSAFSTSAHSPTAAAALVPDIQRPYLTGFDASRPDLDTALSVAPRNPSIATLHRHPASLRGFPHCKPMDIYSLGLVLLEIGLWKVLQAYHKPHYSADRWRHKVVRAVLVPGLGSKVGRRYRDVVDRCLSVSEEMTSAEAAKVMEEVVTALEGIRV